MFHCPRNAALTHASRSCSAQMENQMPLSLSSNNNRRQHHFTRRFRFRSVSPIIRRHVEQHTRTHTNPRQGCNNIFLFALLRCLGGFVHIQLIKNKNVPVATACNSFRAHVRECKITSQHTLLSQCKLNQSGKSEMRWKWSKTRRDYKHLREFTAR